MRQRRSLRLATAADATTGPKKLTASNAGSIFKFPTAYPN